MKKLKLLLIPTIFLFMIVGAFSSNEVPFFDNFNRFTATGDPIDANWTVSPVGGWAGRNSDPTLCVDDAFDDCAESVGGTATTETMTRNISTRQFKNVTLRYMEYCTGSLASENYTISASSDGTTFTTLRNVPGTSCTGTKTNRVINLTSQYWDNANFKLKYSCGARSIATERCIADNVSLSGIQFCILPKSNSFLNSNTNFCGGSFGVSDIRVNKSNIIVSCLSGGPTFQSVPNEKSILKGTSARYLFLNYTLPPNFISAKLQIKHGTASRYNITIPTTCADNGDNKIRLRIFSELNGTGTSRSHPECFDGSSFINIGQSLASTIGTVCTNFGDNNATSLSFMTDNDYTTFGHWGLSPPSLGQKWNFGTNPNTVGCTLATVGESAIFDTGMFWSPTDTIFQDGVAPITIIKSNITIFNCIFNTSTTGIHIRNLGSTSQNNTIIQNTFLNTKGTSIQIQSKGRNVIFNNTFRDIKTGGVNYAILANDLVNGPPDSNIIFKNRFINSNSTFAVINLASSSNIISNNTFINITEPGSYVIWLSGSGTPVSDNNIVQNNVFMNTPSGSIDSNIIIFLDGANNNRIRSNLIFNSPTKVSTGINVGGTFNIISSNVFGNLSRDILSGNNNTLIVQKNLNKIVWNNTVITMISQFKNIFLGNNIVAVNSTAETNLNKKAKITLVNLTYANSQPIIFTNSKFVTTPGAVIGNKTICSSPVCTNVNFNNVTKTLIFDVSGFSSFSTNSTSSPTNYNIFIKDEDTKATILGDGTMLDITPTETREFTTNIGRFGVSNFTFEKHQLDVLAVGPTNYPQRTFFLTINSSTGNFTFFLLNISQGQNVKFNVRDEGGSPVEDADLIFTRFLTPPGGYVAVQQENTQLLGFVNAFLNPLISYRIHVSASGFGTKIFDLQPTETEYTIIIRRTASINFFNFLKDIVFTIIPDTGPIQANPQSNFSLMVTAPNGTLSFFAVKSNFSGTVYLNNITISPSGGTAKISVNTTGKGGQTIGVDYYIKRISSPELLKVHKTYLILGSITASNRSVVGIANTYKTEIGTTWTGIIAIFASVALGLTFLPFTGSIGAGLISLMAFIGFAFVGWISPSIVIVSGIIVVGTYLFTGGRE